MRAERQRRASSFAAIAMTASAALALALAACGGDDEDAPPGRASCVGAGCEDGAAPTDGAAPPPGDAGSSDAADASFPHPLEGTSRTATLVAGGFGFTEGPVWIGGRLLFSDITANQIRELLPDGGTSLFRGNSGGANGNAVDGQGQLVTCEGAQSAKRVTRSAPTAGAPTTPIATTYMAAALNAPNDVVVRADGNVYFTDPNYSGQPDTQDAEAVYRIAPGGAVTRLSATFTRPNGIALSPDGRTLYVVDNGAGELRAAAVDAVGDVGPFSKLGDAPGGDGMAVDDAGNLYVTAQAGVLVLDRTGKPLGTIAVAETPANCTFGGANRRTLYVTARKALYAIETNVPGLP